MAGFFVCGFQITLVATHVPKYVIERGLDGWTGPAILSLIGLFNIFGTLTMGYLADKYSKKFIERAILSKRNYNYFVLIFPGSNFLAIGFGICFGFLWLATIPATFGIVAQVFGDTRYLSMLSGLVFLVIKLESFLEHILGAISLIILEVMIMLGIYQLHFHFLRL